MIFYEMGARQQDIYIYTHRSCERAHLPKIDKPTERVAAVIIEVCSDQPGVDVKVHLHAIIVYSRLACR